MAIAVALLLILVASVAFHLFTPWWLTPLASNWAEMDDTLTVTVVVTGVFFIAINLFVVYAVWKYRHRSGGHRAEYQPYNRRLERWLIGITTVGIVALLAPGLVVYARYLDVPPAALEVEVLGQQWQWRFRLPGADGKLGGTDVRHMKGDNPWGLDPSDPAGADDVLVGTELHLPAGKPVKVLMRSRDVLHDFFVPQFRARMNIVPGQMSWFWFTPTVAGRYEAMCAQLCGVGHPDMRASVVVEPDAAFAAWLGGQQTFAMSRQAPAGGDPATRGRALAASKGCVGCHSVDGAAGVGPTWKGLFGKTETLADGSTALVDEAFVRDFIRDPTARDIKGFANVMPRLEMTDDEREALVAYIKSLGDR